MFDHINHLLDFAGDKPVLVLSIVFVAAVVESALGLGAILPGETVLVVAAVALHDPLLLALAVIAATAGAFTGDHIGFSIGRSFGARIAGTRAVRAVGLGRWHAATGFVERRGFWVIVVARLLPGVRTLISAAAGASGLRYRRFAVATGTAAAAWSLLWVVGGGVAGLAFLDCAQQATIPTVAVAATIALIAIGIRWLLRRPSTT